MPSALKERILGDAKEAMRARDKPRLAALRLIQAAIKQKEIDGRVPLDDADVLVVLEKMVKQLRESISIYREAGRADLLDKEIAELAIVEIYLPKKLASEELAGHIDEVIAELGAMSMRDMGKVMAALKARLQGQADMTQLSQMVKSRLVQP
ncbi:MAG: GatB/YqeY domain-containing protein [Candidatus Eutrophobiaceae bacterium]